MNIVVINCHPRKDSLSDALTKVYVETVAKSGAAVKLITVRDLKFDALIDPTLARALEPDLQQSQEMITWCRHLCIVFPTWWTGLPALGKGFIDRVFQSGFAFQYTDRFPKPLLVGRSARIIHTMASPVLYNYLVVGKPQVKMVREGTLSFCGFKPVKVTAIGGMRRDGPIIENYVLKAFQAANQDLKMLGTC